MIEVNQSYFLSSSVANIIIIIVIIIILFHMLFVFNNFISCSLSSQFGDTPLIMACRKGHFTVVQELLAKNANKDAQNKVRHMK